MEELETQDDSGSAGLFAGNCLDSVHLTFQIGAQNDAAFTWCRRQWN
jgi:hypothetical protein